ncbi:hypothetical protein B9Z55_023431 [Caenorhabditis nigoni]|uniref:Uncharacterized protein n=1 Tax=Caenorhabditis nigoni TaxID=1611254 RepID=A0A2G5SPW6_9PELO|nr:hypothetical protein B9Z55_023431 [Caenorhabditis nigoni]
MWSPTWQLKFAQNRPSPISMKFLPNASFVMGSILAKFQNSFSSSSYISGARIFSLKMDLKAIFVTFFELLKMYQDDENEF